ncbi:MAG: hypothetical protein R3A80_12335 [Bdellovibrionota bacterium]
MRDLFKANEINTLSELDHTVFYGPTFSFYKSALHERIFTEWKVFWESHFQETKSSAQLFSDELLRTTYVLVLHKKELPIGILFSSIWNLWNPVHQHSRYLSNYPAEVKSEFQALRYNSVLSLEYLTIRPDWRYSKCALPLSEVLLGLGLKMFHQNENVDAAISIARRAVKVQDRMAGWGMREVHHMTLHNNPCTITTCNRLEYKKDNADLRINCLTNYFLEKQKRVGFSDLQEGFGLKAA